MSALSDEITNDPLGRGYSGMTDAEVADSLNTANRTVTRSVITGSLIYNNIVPAEFQSKTAEQKDLVRDVFSLGDAIDVGPGTNARDVLIDVFGSGSTTISNLASAIQDTVSRAQELGLGKVKGAHVTEARNG